MGLKDWYYKVEEQWYHFLDGLNRVLPVYKVIDPIDQHIPSLVLVLLLLLAAIIYFTLPFLGMLVQPAVLRVTVTDVEGNPLEGALIHYKGGAAASSLNVNSEGAAQFSGHIGEDVRLLVEADGYMELSTNIRLNKDTQDEKIRLTLAQESYKVVEHAIEFVDSSGKGMEGETIEVRFSCSNAEREVLNPNRTTTTGGMRITPPRNCGVLLATVQADGFEAASVSVSRSGEIISLSRLVESRGGIRVIVTDAEDGTLIDGVQITLRDAAGLLADSAFSDWGEVSFEVPADTYTLSVEDPGGRYPSHEERVEIIIGEVSAHPLSLTQQARAQILVRVVDADTQQDVRDATVQLLGESGNIQAEKNSENGRATFRIRDPGIFFVRVVSEIHLPTQDVRVDASQAAVGATFEVEVELEKLTASNAGRVRIRVTDEEGTPVQGARVFLLYSGSGFLAPYDSRLTDLNGVVEPIFSGVKEGSYAARAQKYPASGESAAFQVATRVLNEAEISLVIGNSTVQVTAENEDGVPIPFAQATFREGNGNILGTVALDAQGRGQLAVRADKKITVRVEADGFAPWISAPQQMHSGKNIPLTAVLEQGIGGDTPTIELSGVIPERGNTPVNQLEAGKLYRALFTVRIPENVAWEEGGFHVRVGNQFSLEQENWRIEKVESPFSGMVRGTLFAPPNGEEGGITNGNAKWAEGYWDSTTDGGVYHITAWLRVNQDVLPGSGLLLQYRAWGIQNGNWFRDPGDVELQRAENSPVKTARYAAAYSREFREGTPEECEQGFCIQHRVTDTAKGIYLPLEPYPLEAFREYALQVTITGESESALRNAVLTIRNVGEPGTQDTALYVTSYQLNNADGVLFEGINEGFGLSDPINAGMLEHGKSITGTFLLRAERVTPTYLEFRLTTEGIEVYRKRVAFTIEAHKAMEVVWEPERVIPFLDQNVYIIAKDAETQVPIEGALVKGIITSPEGERETVTTPTNAAGEGILRLPAIPNGGSVTVSVQSPGYERAELTYAVDGGNAVKVVPDTINGLLNAIGNNEQQFPVSFTNLISYPVILSSFSLNGNFQGLLNKERIRNWLRQYEGTLRLAENGEGDVSVVVALSNAAGVLQEPKRVQGDLLADFRIAGVEGRYPVAIPLDFTIGFSEGSVEDTCLFSSLSEWKASTLESRVSRQMVLTNLCQDANGQELPVQNVSGVLEWSGNVIGQVEVSMVDLQSGQSTHSVLQNNRRSVLLGRIEAGREYQVTVSFVPDPGTLGQVANFTLSFEGDVQGNQGSQRVGSVNPLLANLRVADLEQCIAVLTEQGGIVEIAPGSTQGGFSLDTTGCGNLPLDIRFCGGGADACRGGSVEGGVQVRPWSLSGITATAIQAQVARESIPGMYGVSIEARAPGGGWRKVKTLDVLVHPEEDYVFWMDRYEFLVRGIGSMDATTLHSRSLTEVVGVEASLCDWGKAIEEESGWLNPEYAGTGALAGGLYGLQNALSNTQEKTTQVGTAKYLDLAAAKGAVSSAQTAVSEAQTCITSAVGEAQSAAQIINSNAPVVSSCFAAAPPYSSAQSTAGATTQAAQAALSGLQQAQQALNTAQLDMEQVEKTSRVSDLGQADAILAGAAARTNAVQVTLNLADTLVWEAIGQTTAATESTATTLIQLESAQTEAEAAKATSCAAQPPANQQCAPCTAAIPAIAEGIPPTQATGSALASCDAALANATASITTARGALTTAAGSVGELGEALAKPSFFANACKGSISKVACSVAAYTGLGYLGGGLLGSLTDEDECAETLTTDLVDYTINLVEDAEDISSDVPGISASWDTDAAIVQGEFAGQEVGVEIHNGGVEEAQAVYGVLTLNATQHFHDNPTRIARGITDFGPFNVPDAHTQTLSRKFHVKYITGEIIEEEAPLGEGVLACSKGTLIGRTGEGALPNTKLSWQFQDIAVNECDVQNADSVYCDAVQFNIEISKKLNALREFVRINSASLTCPDNPADDALVEIVENSGQVLDVDLTEEECWIANTTEIYEGKPGLLWFVESADNIQWTEAIPDAETLMEMIYFEAKLMYDGYTPDMVRDFGVYYSTINFADTPSFFRELDVDSSGTRYGINKYYALNRISFRNRYFEENVLPAAGVYRINVVVTLNDEWVFFDAAGNIAAPVQVLYEYARSPEVYHPFLDLPWDGSVGLEGDRISRQGYGAGYGNTGAVVKLNDGADVAYTYPGSGSNPLARVEVSQQEGVYYLNTSPLSRGDLLWVQSPVENPAAAMVFSASRANPLILAVSATERDTKVWAGVTLKQEETIVQTGSSLNYWNGAGSCRDFSNTPIQEVFRNSGDISAETTNAPIGAGSYVLEWENVEMPGSLYLHTILYVPADRSFTLESTGTGTETVLRGANGEGSSMPVNGIVGMEFNQPGNAAQDRVDSIADVMELVRRGAVCVTNSGNEARFYWNPDALYVQEGVETSVSSLLSRIGDTLSCS